MTHREGFDPSAFRRDRSAQGRDGNPWAERSRDRRRHGPHKGGRHEGHEHEFSLRAGRGRGRRQRGDVRFAILALLNERPMHGYEMMQELAERSRGLWRPSPGSLYPALSLLEDQGFVRSQESDGRRQFTLTDEGRAELESHPRATAPWESGDETEVSLHAAFKQLAVAVHQLSAAGSTEQKQKAEALLTELRRQVYLLLAESLAPRDDA